MTSVTLNNVTIPDADQFVFNFSDGTQVQKTRAEIDDLATTVFGPSVMRNVLISRWKGINPALDNPDLINGSAVEVNMESVFQPVTVGVPG